MLGTIRKVGKILELFNGERSEWRLSDIAQTLGIAKSSAHDLVSSLAGIGLLSQTEQGRYRLGWKLVELSEILLETTELRGAARPVIEHVNQLYQETLHLGILDRGKVVYIDTIEGLQTIRVELSNLGSHLYPHCSGVGKVLLAHLPNSVVDRILEENGMPSFTDQTITDRSALKAELSSIRSKGYGYDMGEILVDVRCVAAPIFNFKGDVIAALSMSVPAYRFERSEHEYRCAVIAASNQISRYMGYPL